MKVAAVTCTGGRPELFELCKRWVTRQTRLPDYWLVVTDNGDVISDLPSFAEHKRVTGWQGYAPSPDWAPNTSLLQALLMVPDDHAAVVFEDDDWYAANHIETCERHMAKHDVVYGKLWVRYHVPWRRWNWKGKAVAGEGRVGIRPESVKKYALQLLRRPIYSGSSDGRYPRFTSVGIKGVGAGLPGRHGATSLHHDKNWGVDDRDLTVLRQLIGDADAAAYDNLVIRDGPQGTASVLP